MPSQEPQLGDKNDEVDLPSEENDGSEYSSVKMEFLFFLICSIVTVLWPENLWVSLLL